MSLYDTLNGENKSSCSDNSLTMAIVTNNQDPDGLGRVKVKFPCMSDENESEWARVVTPMAGAEMGAFFLPEVGDEVLIGFLHGSRDHPYVLGSLWNGSAAPPETNDDGKNNIRKIKSRSGHEIVFDDNGEEDKAKLEIKTNAGHVLLLDDAASAEKMELTSKAGHVILLDDASSKEKVEVTSKAGHKITLDDAPGGEKIEIVDKSGSNMISIDSVQNAVNIESGMMLTIKANMVEIEGTTSLTLKSSAMVTIEGAMIKLN